MAHPFQVLAREFQALRGIAVVRGDRRINVKLVCRFCGAPASTEVFEHNDSDRSLLTCDTHISKAFA